jgi:hypothetical protein
LTDGTKKRNPKDDKQRNVLVPLMRFLAVNWLRLLRMEKHELFDYTALTPLAKSTTPI